MDQQEATAKIAQLDAALAAERAKSRFVAGERDTMQAVLMPLYSFAASVKRFADDGAVITAIRFRAPTAERPDWLAVVQVSRGGQRFVGFHSDAAFLTCVTGLCNRLANNTLTFKEDFYGDAGAAGR